MVTINVFNKDSKAGTIKMRLVKVFGTLDHNLLLAKLNSPVFSSNAIKLDQSYLLEQF